MNAPFKEGLKLIVGVQDGIEVLQIPSSEVTSKRGSTIKLIEKISPIRAVKNIKDGDGKQIVQKNVSVTEKERGEWSNHL